MEIKPFSNDAHTFFRGNTGLPVYTILSDEPETEEGLGSWSDLYCGLFRDPLPCESVFQELHRRPNAIRTLFPPIFNGFRICLEDSDLHQFPVCGSFRIPELAIHNQGL